MTAATLRANFRRALDLHLQERLRHAFVPHPLLGTRLKLISTARKEDEGEDENQSSLRLLRLAVTIRHGLLPEEMGAIRHSAFST